jgi:uncharacterized protein YraI
MQAHTLTLCAYTAGLVTTLTLASALTPARWWRRPNARAGAILAGGTWGIGALLLLLLQPMTTADAASTAASDGVAALRLAPAPSARFALKSGVQYRVHESLNLRAGSGTNAARVAVVPAGALVTASGVRDGDWWQLTARVDGKPLQGWASSLWLRRLDEARPRRVERIDENVSAPSLFTRASRDPAAGPGRR